MTTAAAPTSWAASMATAAAAGSAACLVSHPIETAKTRLQLQRELGAARADSVAYRGVAHALATIARSEGAAGLWRGLSAGVAFQVAMNGVRLGAYPVLAAALVERAGASAVVSALAAGAVAGAAGAVAGAPFFLVKVRLQAQSAHFRPLETHAHASPWAALRDVARADGVAGLWRGTGAGVARVAVGSAAQLATYDSAKRAARARGVPEGVWAHVCAAAVAAAALVAAMNPFDVAATRLAQSSRNGPGPAYRGVVDVLRRTLAAEGVAGWYKGAGAHYWRVGPHTVVNLVVLEQLRAAVLRWDRA
jgi:solute carrier family 25 protein 34/35